MSLSLSVSTVASVGGNEIVGSLLIGSSLICTGSGPIWYEPCVSAVSLAFAFIVGDTEAKNANIESAMKLPVGAGIGTSKFGGGSVGSVGNDVNGMLVVAEDDKRVSSG